MLAGKIQHQMSIKRPYYLLKSPGQDLQQRPGRRTGSLHVSSGHSFLMLRQWTLATIRRFFCTWNQTYILLHVTKFQWFSQLKDGETSERRPSEKKGKKKETIGDNVNRLITIQVYRRVLIRYFHFPNDASSCEFLSRPAFLFMLCLKVRCNV